MFRQEAKRPGRRMDFAKYAKIAPFMVVSALGWLSSPVRAERSPAQERLLRREAARVLTAYEIGRTFIPEKVVITQEKGEQKIRFEGQLPNDETQLSDLVRESPKLSAELAQTKPGGFFARLKEKIGQVVASLAKLRILGPRQQKEVTNYLSTSGAQIFGLASGKSQEPLLMTDPVTHEDVEIEAIKTIGDIHEAAQTLAAGLTEGPLVEGSSKTKDEASAACIQMVVEAAKEGTMEAMAGQK